MSPESNTRNFRNFISPLFLICIIVGGCTLPSIEDRTVSTALEDHQADSTKFGTVIAPFEDLHPGKSGVYPLSDPLDAFAARIHLIRGAEQTLDVQYYIWHADMTGTMLLKELFNAAERGVRVRMLLDDNGTWGLDATFAALHEHPNFEIRLFNPFIVRKPKWMGNLFDFTRLNRRMHNKSITADNTVSIAGGRNIGDPYFGASNSTLYSDLDVLLAGVVVKEVSRDFDRYWASKSSYPADKILPAAAPELLNQLTRKASQIEQEAEATDYINAVAQSDFLTSLRGGTLQLEWTDIQMVSDDPAKGLGQNTPEGLLTWQLQDILGEPQMEVNLISAYFVPTSSGVETFRSMRDRGVSVRILTNSLGAADVPMVHAGYSIYRKELLQAGVQLFETFGLGVDTELDWNTGYFGSSATSLHAKTFSIDGERIFVGSYNFDPRSRDLNTELGFVIDSPELAQQISDKFNGEISASAYEVRLNEEEKLYWVEQKDGEQVHLGTEPGSSVWIRIWIVILSKLPIEWLL